MLFSDSLPIQFRQFFFFIALLLVPVFFLFAETAPENPELLSKIKSQLTAHYFRPLTSSELQAKSLTELFSSLDKGTHLEPAKTSELDFVRGLSDESSIKKSEQIQKNVGYIQISFLGRRTFPDFMEALEYLKREGAQVLILDLRGNSGGSLESGVEIIESFVPEGNLLFTFQDKTDKEEKRFSQKKKSVSFPLIVLIDRQTASAAEIVAFALKRYAHAKLIGEPTYGKRSIQEMFPVDSSHVLFLTTAHFILPDHSEEKIKPDFLTSSEKAFEDALSVIKRKEIKPYFLTETETGVREWKAVKAAAAPQL